MTPRCCRTPDLAASRGFPIPRDSVPLPCYPKNLRSFAFVPECPVFSPVSTMRKGERGVEALIILIGTLVPTLAATAFYVGDRRR
ncbi:hypothetical protein GCM10023222_05520 [Saccharopolyspora cebuensis]